MIGVYGGSFDPVHFGHLRIALEITEQLNLSQTLFIPSATPAHRAPAIASWQQRLAMLAEATKLESRFKIDTREAKRAGPSYMVDTLSSLRADYPQTPLCLMLGADAFLGLTNWYQWQKIFSFAHIVIAGRPQVKWKLNSILQQEYQNRLVNNHNLLEKKLAGFIINCTVTELDISSSKIRQLLRSGFSVRYLTLDSIITYIHTQHLYK